MKEKLSQLHSDFKTSLGYRPFRIHTEPLLPKKKNKTISLILATAELSTNINILRKKKLF